MLSHASHGKHPAGNTPRSAQPYIPRKPSSWKHPTQLLMLVHQADGDLIPGQALQPRRLLTSLLSMPMPQILCTPLHTPVNMGCFLWKPRELLDPQAMNLRPGLCCMLGNVAAFPKCQRCAGLITPGQLVPKLIDWQTGSAAVAYTVEIHGHSMLG